MSRHVEYQLIGAPGAGKTTTLANVWLPRAVQRWGAASVAVCSLTRTAAAEIASRNSGVPKDSVGTLHALAWRALDRPEVAEGKISEWNAYAPSYALSGAASNLDEPDADHRGGSPGDEAMAACQVLRHRRVPRHLWPERLRAFQKEWSFWCGEAGLTDFTGLIEEALERVDSAPGAPRVLVVDEVQDCSALEMALVRKWAQSAEYVVLAGDPWQCIYQWRGADSGAFTSEPVPEENKRFLSQSYRCPRAVHVAAMGLVRKAAKALPHKFEPRDFDGRLARIPAQLNFAEEVVRSVRQDGTTMLLATCGFHVAQICTALRNAGIPFHNPYRTTNGRWNPLRGGASRISSFLRPCAETHGDDARLWTWKELHAWVEMCQARELLNPKSKEAIRDAAKAQKGDGNALTSMEMQGLFDARAWESLSAVRAADRDRDAAMLSWLKPRMLNSWTPKVDYALRVAEKRGSRALVSEPKCVVGTFHSVKGGESDRVVVFPDLSFGGMREWTGSSEQRDAILRLFYVAFTRAREELLLASPSSANHIGW